MSPTIPVIGRVSVQHGHDLRRYPRRPARWLRARILLAPLAGVALWTAAQGSATPPRTVYTVAALADRLAHAHNAWIGRTVWVHGEVVTRLNRVYQPGDGPPGLGSMQMYVVDPVATRDIPFMRGPPNPVYVMLRAVPLIGRLAPAPQAPRIDASADYQVQLQALPCRKDHLCDTVVLLDASLFGNAP